MRTALTFTRVLIRIYLLSLLFVVGCDKCGNSTSLKQSQNSKPAAKKIPIAYREETAFAAGGTGPSKEPNAIDKEAAEIISNRFETVALSADGSWFLYMNNALIEVSIENILIVSSMSDAQTRNQEWRGRVGVIPLSYRFFNKEQGVWDKWKDSGSFLHPFKWIKLRKEGTKWWVDDVTGKLEISDIFKGFRKPRVDEIPK